MLLLLQWCLLVYRSLETELYLNFGRNDNILMIGTTADSDTVLLYFEFHRIPSDTGGVAWQRQ